MPASEGPYYAVLSPRWYTLVLRIVTGAMASVFTWFAIRGWSEIPLGFQVMACILLPTFFFMALHPKGWNTFSTKPFLVATARGIFIPGYVEVRVGEPMRQDWLLVPWQIISNIRVEKAYFGDGMSTCAVFDVRVDSEEFDKFFYRLRPQPKHRDPGVVSFAFYGHSPPHPRKVVDRLLKFVVMHHPL